MSGPHLTPTTLRLLAHSARELSGFLLRPHPIVSPRLTPRPVMFFGRTLDSMGFEILDDRDVESVP